MMEDWGALEGTPSKNIPALILPTHEHTVWWKQMILEDAGPHSAGDEEIPEDSFTEGSKFPGFFWKMRKPWEKQRAGCFSLPWVHEACGEN